MKSNYRAHQYPTVYEGGVGALWRGCKVFQLSCYARLGNQLGYDARNLSIKLNKWEGSNHGWGWCRTRTCAQMTTDAVLTVEKIFRGISNTHSNICRNLQTRLHVFLHKIAVFWDMTSCSFITAHQRFGEIYCVHLQGGAHTLAFLAAAFIVIFITSRPV